MVIESISIRENYSVEVLQCTDGNWAAGITRPYDSYPPGCTRIKYKTRNRAIHAGLDALEMGIAGRDQLPGPEGAYWAIVRKQIQECRTKMGS